MMKIKNEREIELMRRSCAVAASVLEEASAFIAPGVTTRQLDQHVAGRIRHYGGRSAFLGYKGFPCHACISVNEQVVHGLAGDRRLLFGDIVSLDIGVMVNGFIGDNARTVVVGGCDPLAQKLIDVTEKALYEGISQALPGNRVSDISRAIQSYVESNGFSVVREFVGHGVGRSMHEDPQVPNYVDPKCNQRLVPGLTIAIEPMVNAGKPSVKVLRDGWTVVTEDGLPSAHFEHTVLITPGSPEILTWPLPVTSASAVSSPR
jgi:methionyl aminopeptidase